MLLTLSGADISAQCVGIRAVVHYNLGNIAFNIADELHSVINAISHSLSVNYGSVY